MQIFSTLNKKSKGSNYKDLCFKGVGSLKVLAYCPKCNKPIIDAGDVFGCIGAISNGDERCTYAIPKLIHGAEIKSYNVPELVRLHPVIQINSEIYNSKEDYNNTQDLNLIKENDVKVNELISNQEETLNQINKANSSEDNSKKKESTKIIGKCPKCNSGDVIQDKLTFPCTECDFSLNRKLSRVFLKDKDIKSLLANKEVHNITLRDKGDIPYTASIFLENYKYKIVRNENATNDKQPISKKIETLGHCPKCNKGNVIYKDNNYTCNNDTCDFSLSEKFSNVKMSKNTIKTLLKGEQTDDLWLVSKTGKKYKGKVELKNLKYSLVLNNNKNTNDKKEYKNLNNNYNKNIYNENNCNESNTIQNNNYNVNNDINYKDNNINNDINCENINYDNNYEYNDHSYDDSYDNYYYNNVYEEDSYDYNDNYNYDNMEGFNNITNDVNNESNEPKNIETINESNIVTNTNYNNENTNKGDNYDDYDEYIKTFNKDKAYNKSSIKYPKKVVDRTINKPANNITSKSLGLCPKCKNHIVKGKTAYGCMGIKGKTCDLMIPFEKDGAKIEIEDIKELLQGKTSEQKLFKGNDGREYLSHLRLNNDGTLKIVPF